MEICVPFKNTLNKEVRTETNNETRDKNWNREEIGEMKDRTWGIAPVFGEECTRGHIPHSAAVARLMFHSVKKISSVTQRTSGAKGQRQTCDSEENREEPLRRRSSERP